MTEGLQALVDREPLNVDARWRLSAELVGHSDLETALKEAQHAVALDPLCAKAWAILGAVHNTRGEWHEAMTCHNRSLQIAPDAPSVRWNRFWANMAVGNYAEAWEDQEHGRRSGLRPNRLIEREWQGEDLTGKTIFVWSEQGFGDCIQFARYLPFLKGLGARVVFETYTPLLRLFGHLADVVVGQPDDFSVHVPYDYHCPLLSLPLKFQRYHDMTYIPTGIYIKSEADVQPTKVGFCWKGRETHPNDVNRSLSEDEARIMEGAVDVVFNNERPFEGVEFGNGADFVLTAANLKECRVLITIDSAIAHLAGAMGIETHLIIPLNGEGRWGCDGSETGWYPSVKIYRPVNDFTGVLNEIKAIL